METEHEESQPTFTRQSTVRTVKHTHTDGKKTTVGGVLYTLSYSHNDTVGVASSNPIAATLRSVKPEIS